MVNKVMLLGYVGRDPEVRSTPTGQPVASFSMATSRRWKDKSGQRQEQTEWHNIVVWGKQAEIAGQYLTKGKQIYLEGRLQTRSWEDRQSGEKRYRTEIVCDNFQMLGGGQASDDQAGSAYAREQSRASETSAAARATEPDWAASPAPDDDDIPF